MRATRVERARASGWEGAAGDGRRDGGAHRRSSYVVGYTGYVYFFLRLRSSLNATSSFSPNLSFIIERILLSSLPI